MDSRLERFLEMFPRGDTLSLLRAADILGGEYRAPELLHLVAIGDLFSRTHGPAHGPQRFQTNHLLGAEIGLPRITLETDPKTVIVESEAIIWLWCVEYEEWLQGVDFPPKDTIEAREAAVKLLARRGNNPKAPEAVLPASDNHAPQTAAPAWSLKRAARFQGYRKPLYDFLKAAHSAGKPRPNARDVLDSWKSKRPDDVSEVTDNGLKYYDAQGNTKLADLAAISKAIGRLIKQTPD